MTYVASGLPKGGLHKRGVSNCERLNKSKSKAAPTMDPTDPNGAIGLLERPSWDELLDAAVVQGLAVTIAEHAWSGEPRVRRGVGVAAGRRLGAARSGGWAHRTVASRRQERAAAARTRCLGTPRAACQAPGWRQRAACTPWLAGCGCLFFPARRTACHPPRPRCRRRAPVRVVKGVDHAPHAKLV